MLTWNMETAGRKSGSACAGGNGSGGGDVTLGAAGITSRGNGVFKDLLKLTQKKYRRQTGLCIVEGVKIVKELVAKESAENGSVLRSLPGLNQAQGGSLSSSCVKVFIKKSKAESPVCREIAGILLNNLPGGGKRFEPKDKLVILDDKLFDTVSGLENSSGVLASVIIPKAREITFPYLVLDGLQDTGNMGTVLRTAFAFGFKTVFCIDCADAWGQKVLRASSGIQFGLNIIETSLREFKKPEKSMLIAADLNGAGIEELALSDRFGLVLGSEGRGVSAEIKGLVDAAVTIPMDSGCESLNVAAAGAVLMHYFMKK